MRKWLHHILPENHRKRKWIAITISLIFAGGFTVWGIYGIGEYGLALFIFTPLLLGALPTILYGLKKELRKMEAWQLSLLTVTIFMAVLAICAMEGAICIAMAAPFAFFLSWVGSLIGYGIVKRTPDQMLLLAIWILIASVPATAFIEKDIEPGTTTVTTSMEIDADAQTVWDNLVSFPQLDAPTEFIFKTGIAYPTDATIEGSGVGAVRYCNFTTGSFIEPITVWDEPHLLRFDVQQQPAPMKELSFREVDAPHLHNYFVSQQGQFALSTLPNGHTLLVGTTWYTHDIKPGFYWKLWSDHIIHTIHLRVLKHIKSNAENQSRISEKQ